MTEPIKLEIENNPIPTENSIEISTTSNKIPLFHQFTFWFKSNDEVNQVKTYNQNDYSNLVKKIADFNTVFILFI